MKFSEPVLSITGVTKAHAKRAMQWMKNRSLAAFYNAEEKSLCALEFKHGEQWTYHAMLEALAATK